MNEELRKDTPNGVNLSSKVGTQSAHTCENTKHPVSNGINSPVGLSISVCTYNRANVLKNCLESLAKLTTDKQLYEIIVVNNNCTDHTSEVCQNFAKAHPDIPFRQVFEPKPGLPAARNKSIVEAKFELLAFIDDDATVEPNYADTIMKAFKDYPEYNAGGGKVIIVFEDNYKPKFFSKYLNPFSAIDLGNKKSEFTAKFGVKFPCGCNMYFRKKIFEKYGDFDDVPLRGEDKHMFYKLMKEGKERVLYMPEVVVYHHQEKERCSYENLMDLAYTNGKSIALWLADKGTKRQRIMAIERTFIFLVAVGLGAFYCITFRPAKAKYIVAYMYQQMKGYFNYWRIKEK